MPRRTSELDQAKRLERGLVVVRWLWVALGLYLVSQATTTSTPRPGTLVVAAGHGLMAALAAGNVIVWGMTGRVRSVRGARRLGLGAFALDAAVAYGLAWLFSYDPNAPAWAVLYILPLEGAVRYRLGGALAVVAVTFASEVLRESYMDGRFAAAYQFVWPRVVLRVGIQALVALVAGLMARSLAREAENAAEQARRFQEAARRESLARRELAAFNTAILTGVAVEDIDLSIQLMASAVGRDLGFEGFTIMLREGDELVVKGAYGVPTDAPRNPIATGVAATVARTGKPMLVPDLSAAGGGEGADHRMRSEMAAPLRIGDEVIGVVAVESRDVNTLDDAALGVLTRLADQIALVVHSSRLHAGQKQTLERLRELDQMKSDFVAIASHELRTPLTAIHGYVTTLARRFDRLSRDEILRFLDTISRQSERMTRLVEDLLLVSRIEAGTIRIETERLDLRAFLEGTLESLGPGDRSRIRLEAPEGAAVEIDPDRVDQVLRNLIGNALKFSPPESPVLVRASVDDGYVELAVVDRGVGIPASEVPYVFERFHQAGSVTTRQAEGAGLGLYITKRLVDAMGGTIRVSSSPRLGSTFTARLPQPAASDARGGSGNERAADPGGGIGPEDGAAPVRPAAEGDGREPVPATSSAPPPGAPTVAQEDAAREEIA